MCGKNHVRYISTFILGVLFVIALCGFALASASSAPPVKGTSPSSKPASSAPKSGVKDGAAPTLTSIDPNKSRQGDYVTLHGANFGSAQGSSYASFGPFKATVYSVWSDTEIRCVVPPITGATFPVTGPVVVVTSNGTSNAVAFTVLAPNPTVTSITPWTWGSNSVVNIIIIGTGFQTGATVILDSNGFGIVKLPVSNVVVESSTRITGSVTIPGWSQLGTTWEFPFPPPFKAYVTNPDGGQGAGGSFTVTPNPCGAGAISPIVGLGLVMGIMTLTGTVRARRRRTKKS